MKKLLAITLLIMMIVTVAHCQSFAAGGVVLGGSTGTDQRSSSTSTPTPVPTATQELSANQDDDPAERAKELYKFKKVGSHVLLGAYEQDNDSSNGKEAIEWIVLEYNSEDNISLLLSKDTLDYKKMYNARADKVSWRESSLRKWLNSSFFDQAFDENEKSALAPNPVLFSDETDMVFLLSEGQASYFFKDEDRLCKSSKYAKSISPSHEYSPWWLQDNMITSTKQRENNWFRIVGREGEIVGIPADMESFVRPAIRVDLESIYFNSTP